MILVFSPLSRFFLLRRVLSRDLRLLSDFSDYALLVITGLPFLTGYWLTHGTLDAVLSRYSMQIIHTLSGELMLVMIPLSKLSHLVLFFFSRGASAVEFGRRGYSM
jgi:nitrate reductase gamma subunit